MNVVAHSVLSSCADGEVLCPFCSPYSCIPAQKRSGPTDHTFHWVGGSHSVKHHTRMKVGRAEVPAFHEARVRFIAPWREFAQSDRLASESVTAHEDLQAEVDSFAWFIRSTSVTAW